MNIEKGMRRIGVVAGVFGAIVGACLAAGTASNTFRQWEEVRKFR